MRHPAAPPNAPPVVSQEATLQDAVVAAEAMSARITADVATRTAQEQAALEQAAQIAAQSGTPSATPALMYEAARATRRELGRQRDDLQQVRGELEQSLTALAVVPGAETAARPGIEARLQQVDGRLLELDQQIAAADLRVAQTAGVPGSTTQPPRQGVPDEVIAVPIVFTIFVMFPIAIAYARRLWKRPAAAPAAAIPTELREQLRELNTAVEAIGLEVERIGEGQRYVTKVLGEGPVRVPLEAGRQHDAIRQR